MSATVHESCPIVSTTGIASADPVRGVTWQRLGAASNHLLGRGGVLIPTTSLGAPTLAKGSTATYYLSIHPRYQATHRVWSITCKGDEATVVFTDPSGGTSSWVTADYEPQRAYSHIETITSRSGSVGQVTVTLAVPGGSVGDATPISIGCYEVARPELATSASDVGVDLDTVGGGISIYAATGKSIGGVIDGIEAAATTARRCGLLYLLRGSDEPWAFTSTSLVAIHSGVLPALDRKLYRSETARDVGVWVYGTTGAATTMAVVVSSTSDSVTLNWAAADAGSWQSGVLSVSVEDLADARGQQGGVDDLITVEGKRPTGADTAHVHSACLLGT